MVVAAEHGLERDALLRGMDALGARREARRATAQNRDRICARGDENDEGSNHPSVHSASHPSSSASGMTAGIASTSQPVRRMIGLIGAFVIGMLGNDQLEYVSAATPNTKSNAT